MKDGVTPNDLAASCADGAPDCDAGPNELQNFPVLTGATTGATTTVSGNINSVGSDTMNNIGSSRS